MRTDKNIGEYFPHKTIRVLAAYQILKSKKIKALQKYKKSATYFRTLLYKI